MKYAFIREYNSSYDFFLVRYFREGGGIDIGEDDTLKIANSIYEGLRRKGSIGLDENQLRQLVAWKDNLNQIEKFFCDYVSLWRAHPESRPSLYSLLTKIPGIAEGQNLDKLMQLESQLPSGRRKIIFSIEDTADDFALYYRRQIRNPLNDALKRGATGRDIMKYFVLEEIERVPDSRKYGIEKVEEAIHLYAEDLLLQLDRVTPQRVLHDIQRVLTEYSTTSNRMGRRGNPPPAGKKLEKYEDRSEYVRLSVYRAGEQDAASMFLSPSRGHGAVEEYYWDVLFPTYRIMRIEENGSASH